MWKRTLFVLWCLGMVVGVTACSTTPQNQSETTTDAASSKTAGDAGDTGKCWWCTDNDNATDAGAKDSSKPTPDKGDATGNIDQKCMGGCTDKGVSKTDCIGYCWRGDKSDQKACTTACVKAGGPEKICAGSCGDKGKDPGKGSGKGDDAKKCYDQCIKDGGTSGQCEPKCYKGAPPGGQTDQRRSQSDQRVPGNDSRRSPTEVAGGGDEVEAAESWRASTMWAWRRTTTPTITTTAETANNEYESDESNGRKPRRRLNAEKEVENERK